MGCGSSKLMERQKEEDHAKKERPAVNAKKKVEESGSSGLAVIPQRDGGVRKMDEELVFYMKGVDEKLRLSCWDFAGQDTFYGLHQLYMGRNGLYALAFNMGWCANSSNPAELKGHLDFLGFWLDAIAAHARDPKDNSIAPIILVGTHKDIVVSLKDHEDISTMLDETFRHKPAWASVQRFEKAELRSGLGKLWFFPVNNKIGNKDKFLLEIKKVVQEVVKKEKYVNTQVPFLWLKVLERMQDQDMASSLTLEQVVEIFKDCDSGHNPGGGGEKVNEEATPPLEAQVLAMLNLFNDLGQLMFHETRHENSMKRVVILNPADYLVEPASRIVCDHDMHENKFLKQAREKELPLYNQLRVGILDTKLLDILWQDRREHIQVLITLMVKFGFLVPIIGKVKDRDMDNEKRCYLVPALLPKRLVRSALNDVKPKLVGYFFFAHKETMEDVRKKGYIAVDQVKRLGFLPLGLGPAVTGQIVWECQRLYDMTIDPDDMLLSTQEVFTAYGKHKFLLRINAELPMMEVQIMVDSSLLIVEQLLAVIERAIAQTVPTLEVVFAVAQDGGLCPSGVVPTPKGTLVIISGDRGLQTKLDAEVAEIPVGPGQRWSSIEAQKTFEVWLRAKGLREDGYHVFLSYRWTLEPPVPSGGMDTKLVDDVYKKLCHSLVGSESPRQVHVFLDRHRLQHGRRFDKDFATALIKSKVAVPIVSKAALQKFKKLKANSPIDNLLLEWVLICELLESRALGHCVPVMIGDVTEEASGRLIITNLFVVENNFETLPEVVCEKVVSFVKSLLEDAGQAPSKFLDSRTVRGTVETITKYLGVPTWEFTSSHGGGGASRSSPHTCEETKIAIYREIVNRILWCVEKAVVHGTSTVTSGPSLEGVARVFPPPPLEMGVLSLTAATAAVLVWSAEEVSQYVGGMTQEFGERAGVYASRLLKEDINGLALVDLSSEDLKELDFAMGHRKVLHSRIAALRTLANTPGTASIRSVALQDGATPGTAGVVTVKVNVTADAEEKEIISFADTASVVSADRSHEPEKASPQVEIEPYKIEKEAFHMSSSAPDVEPTLEEEEEEEDCVQQTEIAETEDEIADDDDDEEESEGVLSRAFASHALQLLDAQRLAQLMEEAGRRGRKKLNMSRLNIVGEGRAGKTAWMRAVSNLPFEDTDSTMGVNVSHLEVDGLLLKTGASGNSQTSASC